MEPTPRRSWWARHWKWVAPIGCLLPLVGSGGLFTVILVAVSGALKSLDDYAEAPARARADERVATALGEPIEAGFLARGSPETSGAAGSADLSIRVSGLRGSAWVYAVATREAGG